MDSLIIETVTKEINFKQIRDEIKKLKAEGQPTKEDLLNFAKANHPYYQNKERVRELKTTLEQYNEEE